jgi:8-oxo-dGTP diphosphatase
MREFGERRPGLDYIRRPGSYALIVDEEGRAAAVRTDKGLFLLGGGAEPWETAEAAVRREVLEESGHEIVQAELLEQAIEYVSAAGGHLAKECTFFRVRLGRRVREPDDAHHVLCWLPIADVIRDLAHRSQAWALALLISPARP